MKYERETCNLLRRLGVNNSYVGFRYTVYGVIRAIANPELLIYISKGLYVEISAEYRTSIGCVERNPLSRGSQRTYGNHQKSSRRERKNLYLLH